jgi:DNA-binding transcriptional LysR family regulator
VPAHTVVRYRSMAGVVNAVAAGMGLAPLPAHCFEDPVFKDVLIPVLTDHPVWETELYILYISRKHIAPKIRSFLDFSLEITRLDSTLSLGNYAKDGCPVLEAATPPSKRGRASSRVAGI